ncbi:phospholipid/cholesterol/gamma-HCH transport system substrate-binding protein [Mycobacterium sp. OAS707]|uniref:MCE family protein n=1 Tax=Mycobacterium sp. OAS707 TaxID=2663822 RepID=UPI00178B94F8|nr:MCE family protein [Mycobacterium sp. OAS707]MBE1551750.1 phospholipid/cholesterol/gamma-HCH transport system substrate-binding protein [Mycobacterium sp. OAS707]
MRPQRYARIGLAAILVVILAAASYLLIGTVHQIGRTHIVAYFANSNGVFVGDDVRIRGVNVGTIDKIQPEPDRVKISFWIDDSIKVPADVKAVILSPTLVTARAIQLTPPYRSGPALKDNAVIDENRTAVPMEWDDFRGQLQRLSDTLKPTEPGGVSTLGEFVSTTANNLRGQGPAIHDAIIKLSQTVSALGDHSADTFTSVKNLATLVTALQDSTDLIRQLNQNLASVSGLLADDPDEVGNAVNDLNDVVADVSAFVNENRDALGTTTDKLASVSTALNEKLGDLKQLLHAGPTVLSNAVNVYQPAQGTLSGALAMNNFSNPITFLCGAIEAASRQGAEQSSKLCVQYLAPIIKNRQYNFLPFGLNPFVGASARPNEVTYSEDRLRPDFIPPQTPAPTAAPADGSSQTPMGAGPVLPAEAEPAPGDPPTTQSTDPATGLPGLMLPPGGGS